MARLIGVRARSSRDDGRGHRLLGDSIHPDAARDVARRFVLGPALYLIGTLLGALVPVLGVVVFAGLILFYWLPQPSRSGTPAEEG